MPFPCPFISLDLIKKINESKVIAWKLKDDNFNYHRLKTNSDCGHYKT